MTDLLVVGVGALVLAAVVIVGLTLPSRLAAAVRGALADRLDAALAAQGRVEQALRTELAAAREESSRTMALLREELRASLKDGRDGTLKALDGVVAQLGRLTEGNEKRLEALRETLDVRMKALQAENDARLEKMRQTVDEKLQGTLEKRLGESFKLVSERLEAVQRGLGEMQTLATGVGDLKKVLSNVKVRGTWGEVQLGALLEQMLTKEQFATNVAPRPDSRERVEFAIRLPGRDDEGGEVLLPIDAKFPQEDYQRLVEASERGDAEGVEACSRALELRIKGSARDIHDKYIHPPHTTDFGILFLPTEGLYAEVVRRPGLVDGIQRDFKVSVAGPTTLAALLNSLQMGFRTLAIQKRSSEVWQVLGAVKAEFGKFGEVLEKVDKKLQEASNHIQAVGRRRRAIERKLKDVAALPASEQALLPGVPDEEAVDDLEEETVRQ
jgi:DNA recombination protein RmuC